MALAIKIKGADGAWFLLADGIQARTGVVDSWLEMAREIYPGSEVRVVEEAPLPAPETPTHH